MSLTRKLWTGAATALLASLALVSPAAASTTADDASDSDGNKSCVMVLGKAQPGKAASPVLSFDCYDDRSKISQSVNAQTLLFVGYEHSGYRGATIDIQGAYGPCDARGYEIPDLDKWYPEWGGTWNDDISSFKTYNKCHDVTVWEDTNMRGASIFFYGHTSYVGDAWNDRISSLWLRNDP